MNVGLGGIFSLGVRAAGGGGVTPITMDFSDYPDGALPFFTGATWAIVSGRAVNTPTLSDEILNDPGVEIWTAPTNLTHYTESQSAGSSVNQESTEIHGGTYAVRFDVDSVPTYCAVNKTSLNILKNNFLLADYWVRASAVGKSLYVNTSTSGVPRAPGTTWTNYIDAFLIGATLTTVSWLPSNAASSSIYLDDLSLKTVSVSASMAYKQLTYTKPQVRVYGTLDAQGATFGVATCVDDPSNPQNYMIAYCNGYRAFLSKCVAGTFTSLAVGFVSYVAGAPLDIVWTSDTTVDLYYNGSQVGTTATVGDAMSGQYVCLVAPHDRAQINGIRVYPTYGGSFLTIGDSITVGGSDEINGKGYRLMLSELSGNTMRVQNPASNSSGGWTVASVRAQIDTYLAGASKIPNHILIYLGANDVAAMPVEATYKSDMNYLLDALHTKWADAQIFVGIGGRTGQDANTTILTAWNAACLSGRGYCHAGISYNDIFSGNEATLLADSVHPNHAGYVAKTAAWKEVLGW